MKFLTGLFLTVISMCANAYNYDTDHLNNGPDFVGRVIFSSGVPFPSGYHPAPPTADERLIMNSICQFMGVYCPVTVVYRNPYRELIGVPAPYNKSWWNWMYQPLCKNGYGYNEGIGCAIGYALSSEVPTAVILVLMLDSNAVNEVNNNIYTNVANGTYQQTALNYIRQRCYYNADYFARTFFWETSRARLKLSTSEVTQYFSNYSTWRAMNGSLLAAVDANLGC